MRTVRSACALVLLALLASPVAAEYVVFTDGRYLEVIRCRFEAQQAIVSLPGGGMMRFPSGQIRLIVPDEDVKEAPERPDQAGAEGTGWIGFADPRFVEPIQRIAQQHGIDPGLVAAVIKVESDFRQHAVSPRGAKGLMQLMPGTAREHGVTDPFDAEANIGAGCRYLTKLLRRYKQNRSLALAAYNAGPTAVDRVGGIPPYPETRKYVKKVLALAALTD